MLAKDQRISRSAFPTILKRGKTLHSDHFSFKYLQVSGKPQFSIVISKRIVKGAVDRHRLKRRVYATLQEVQGAHKPTFSGIFFAKQGSGNLTPQALSEEIKRFFAQSRF